MKVAVVVITYNLPSDVFLLQIEAIKKFCKDDFEIQIFDNSNDMNKAADISYHAKELGLSYNKTNASSENGSDSHSFAAGVSYQFLRNKYKAFLYLDHDCIPVREFSILEMLGEDKIIGGLGQGGNKTYFWPGMVFWRNDKIDNDIIDFNFSHDLGLDSGGNLYKIIEKYGIEKCLFFNEEYCQNPNYNGKYNHYAMINNGMFMHFVNTSGWNPIEDNTTRINSLINIAKEKINAA